MQSTQHLINSEHTSQHTIEMQLSLERGLQVYSNPDEQEILKAVIQSGEHSALTWATCGHDEQIRIIKLLELKEDVNCQVGEWRNTALHWAIANSNVRSALVLLLYAKDLNPNIVDYANKTALHLALAKGWDHKNFFPKNEWPQSEIIKELIPITSLDLKDNFGNTPLHIAIMRRDYTAVKLLMEHGARLDIKNNQGYQPIDMLTLNFEQVTKILENTTRLTFTLNKDMWEKNKENIIFIIKKYQFSQYEPRLDSEHKRVGKLALEFPPKAELKKTLPSEDQVGFTNRKSDTTHMLQILLSEIKQGAQTESPQPKGSATEELKSASIPHEVKLSSAQVIKLCEAQITESNIKLVEEVRKKILENREYAEAVSKLYDLGIRNPQVYLNAVKNQMTTGIVKLFTGLQEHQLLKNIPLDYIECAIIEFRSIPIGRSNLKIEILLNIKELADQLKNTGTHSEFLKAHLNLVKCGRFNCYIFYKLMWEKRFIDPARGLFELTHRASLVAYTINILAERNLLISLVNKLEILEVENRLNSNIKRACQNLLTHGCINMGAYNKLLQGMHSADAKPTPLAESIANKINDLEEQGFLYLLVNENQLEKMCQLDSEINVDLFFNQLTDHLTRSPFSLKK